MHGQKFSRWDQLPDPGTELTMFPASEFVGRCEARVRSFERVAVLGAGDRSPGALAARRGLVDRFQLRKDYWLASESAPTARGAGWLVAAALVFFGVFLSLACAAAYAGACAVLAIGPPVIGLLSWRLVWKPIGIAEAFEDRQCPDCRYDLAALPAAIDPADLDGVWIGPRECPECGAPWPRVPPPAPGEGRLRA